MAKVSFLSSFFGKSFVGMVLALAIAITASEFKWNVVGLVFIFVFLIAAVVCVIAFFFRAAASLTAKADEASDKEAGDSGSTQRPPKTTNRPPSPWGNVGKAMLSGAVRELMGGNMSSIGSSRPSRSTPAEPTTDERVNIELLDLSGGSWKRMTSVPANPAAIDAAFKNLRQASPGRKMRAIGAQTGQIYDLR